MPTYDYVCDACGHAFELFQSITADPEKTCPECGRRKLRRLIGTGAAILVGGRSSGSESGPADSSGSGGEGSESSSDSTSSGGTGEDSGNGATTSEKTAPEKKISGSTSTPTHEAREGRGVGNLVDAVRRQRKEGSSEPKRKSSEPGAKKAAKKTSKKSSGKSTGRSGNAGKGGRGGSGGSKSKK